MEERGGEMIIYHREKTIDQGRKGRGDDNILRRKGRGEECSKKNWLVLILVLTDNMFQ